MKHSDHTYDLADALLALKTTDECVRFLSDLCTPQEIEALQERWRVCQLLNQGELSYREIQEKTEVGLVTITRVARFLKDENNNGYKIILNRLTKTGKKSCKKSSP